jgi:nucleoside phosphorylase
MSYLFAKKPTSPTSTKLTNNDFKIGIIAASVPHLTACRLILEKEYNGRAFFFQPRGDDNCYTFGKIGSHNVVMAILPDSMSTTGVILATQMTRTFTKLTHLFFLTNGIGVPEQVNVGDVFVPTSVGFWNGEHIKEEYKLSDVDAKFVEKVNETVSNKGTLEKMLSDMIQKIGRESTREKMMKPNSKKEDACVISGKLGTTSVKYYDSTRLKKFYEEHKLKCLETNAHGLYLTHNKVFTIVGISNLGDEDKEREWEYHVAGLTGAYVKYFLECLVKIEI